VLIWTLILWTSLSGTPWDLTRSNIFLGVQSVVIERPEVYLVERHILVLDRLKRPVFGKEVIACSSGVESSQVHACSKKKASLSFFLLAFLSISFLLGLPVQVLVYLIENSEGCILVLVFHFLLVLLLPLLLLPSRLFDLLLIGLLLVDLLKLRKSVSEPIVPPVEWYSQSFHLVKEFLAIYFVNVF